ncbi:MAG: tail fiber domain-containing protein, partial [Phycisphaerales bacterium]|nr:tail fiber domain-containing protein [Phycisphaerales bacterium]
PTTIETSTATPLMITNLDLSNLAVDTFLLTENIDGVIRKLNIKQLSTFTDGWALQGNSGTNPDMNFIGTTDAALVFKTFGRVAGLLSDTNLANLYYANTFFGAGAGASDATNYSGLQSSTVGNTAVGTLSLANANKASSNSIIENVAIGFKSLYSLQTGTGNLALGTNSLNALRTADNNIAIGNNALPNATGGDYNIAVGTNAMLNARPFLGNSANIAIGNNSMNFLTSGNYNVGIGNSVMSQSAGISGQNNVGIGNAAINTLSTGSGNVGIGFQALYSNANSNNNVGIGNMAGYMITTGSDNIAIGSEVLSSGPGVSGNDNIFMGNEAAALLTSGSSNIGIGELALSSLTNSNYNIAIGFKSGVNVSTGTNDILIGGNTGGSIRTGNNNVIIGGGSSIGLSIDLPNANNQLNIMNSIIGSDLTSPNISSPTGSIYFNTNTVSMRALSINLGGSPLGAPLEVGESSSSIFSWTASDPQANFLTAPSSAITSFNTAQTLATAAIFHGRVMIDNPINEANAPAYLAVNGTITVSSDSRLKKIIDTSNSYADLAILNKIKITDYKMRDSINDRRLYKKVIAQQIQQVYPTAISEAIPGFLPTIYKPADSLIAEKNNVYRIVFKPTTILLDSLFVPHNQVRIFTEAGHLIEVTIDTVYNNSFTCTKQPDQYPLGKRVFVYGPHTNNVLHVDYDALAMLNISATQELAKELKNNQDSVRFLNKKIDSLNLENTKKINYLELTLEKLYKELSQEKENQTATNKQLDAYKQDINFLKSAVTNMIQEKKKT